VKKVKSKLPDYTFKPEGKGFIIYKDKIFVAFVLDNPSIKRQIQVFRELDKLNLKEAKKCQKLKK